MCLWPHDVTPSLWVSTKVVPLFGLQPIKRHWTQVRPEALIRAVCSDSRHRWQYRTDALKFASSGAVGCESTKPGKLDEEGHLN